MGEMRARFGALAVAALLAACMVGIWVATPLLAITVAAAAGAFLVRLVAQARNHLELARVLRRGSDLGSHDGVAVRWRSLASGAVVAGFRDPQIYCDRRLADRLGGEEFTAVVLHERYHQVSRDPLRLLLLSSVEPAIARFATGRRWLTHQRAQIEIAADRFALDRGVRRSSLARAILRVGGAPQARYASAGFGSAQELRLRALVDGRVPPATRASSRWPAAVGMGLVVLTCGAAILHHLTATGGQIGCALAGC